MPKARVKANAKDTAIQRILDTEFTAVAEFRAMSKEKRVQRALDHIEALRPLAVFCGEILSYDRSELIEKAEQAPDDWGALLEAFEEGAETAETLSKLFKNAQARLLVAVVLAGIPPLAA